MPAMRNLTASRRVIWHAFEQYSGLNLRTTPEPMPCDTCTQLGTCRYAYQHEAADCAYWTDGTEPEPPDIDRM